MLCSMRVCQIGTASVLNSHMFPEDFIHKRPEPNLNSLVYKQSGAYPS